MNILKLVVPKGRIFAAVARLLEDSGIRIAECPRQYAPHVSDPEIEVKIMKPQKSGRIINIGSISSITPRANGAAYAATKLALEGLTRSIALDYREYNIGASIIHLGATATSWMKVRPEEATGPEYHLRLDDVGRLATFMAALPTEANMFETTILPIQQRSFIGRG